MKLAWKYVLDRRCTYVYVGYASYKILVAVRKVFQSDEHVRFCARSGTGRRECISSATLRLGVQYCAAGRHQVPS
jgi:hypothetical protein